ncbi:hypothetical protein U1Q18_050931, partial [Sarracenia purpurea var. burkii]
MKKKKEFPVCFISRKDRSSYLKGSSGFPVGEPERLLLPFLVRVRIKPSLPFLTLERNG